MTPRLTLGFSPCPNDTFIFYHLLHKQEQLGFTPVIEDVETLNRMALAGQLDICKVSIAVYPLIRQTYVLLDSGGAMGYNCGPILMTKPGNNVSDLSRCTIAIPGEHTTANLLLTRACPQVGNKREMVFSAIESAVLSGEVDAGVIIHENRFTYAKKGLVKVIDLGEWWHEKTGMPVPLGGIVARRSLGEELISKVDRLLAQSVRFALTNPEVPMSFVRAHAQEMDENVMRQHIGLYVNEFTVSLGASGRSAIDRLVESGAIRTS